MSHHLLGPIRRVAIEAASAGTDIPAVAAAAGKRIAVIHYCLSTDTQGALTFKSESTTIGGPLYVSASSGAIDESEFGLFITEAGEALNIARSTSMAVGGYLIYRLID